MAAIEGRGFQRLGEETVRRSSFRLVCATNRPLVELRGEALDQDFFDRVAIYVLEVPPLRKCVKDLPDAWQSVLRDATRTAGVRPDGWEAFLDHPQLLAALAGHPLPGNFRDLQRAAFHLLAAVQAGRTERRVIECAVAALGPREGGQEVPQGHHIANRLPIDDLRQHLAAYEWAWLKAALDKASGNKSEAARLVGLPRKTFEHRLRSVVGELGGAG